MASRPIQPGLFVPGSVDDPELSTFLQMVAERLETVTGDRGFPKGRGVTMEELEAAGIATVDVKNNRATLRKTSTSDGTSTTVISTGSSSFNPRTTGAGAGDILRYSPQANEWSVADLFDTSDLLLDTVVQETNVTQHRQAAALVPTTGFTADQVVATADIASVLEFAGDGTAGFNTLTLDAQANVAYVDGSWVEVINVGTGNLTVAVGAGVTLRFLDGGGVLNTGNRTLAIAGWARIARTASDVWTIRGDGLT